MKRKRPRDTNQLAKFIVDLSVADAKETDRPQRKARKPAVTPRSVRKKEA